MLNLPLREELMSYHIPNLLQIQRLLDLDIGCSLYVKLP